MPAAIARQRVAYLVEPRFTGGTSSAVAQELASVAGLAQISVHEIQSGMFRGDHIAPVLADAMRNLRLSFDHSAAPISADVIVVQNLSLYRRPPRVARRLFCRHLIAVAHENFLRPTPRADRSYEGDADWGPEAFDVAGALDRIAASTVAHRLTIAPISSVNRQSVETWARRHGLPEGWQIAPHDWQNICNFTLRPATANPRDRRGRHSRPGPEKFPPLDVLDRLFPDTAETNIILGSGDAVLAAAVDRPHWQAVPFGGLPVDAFLEQVDFLIHYTAPTWRESFGRAIAEGLAAGKVVLTDPATARTFDDGVIAAAPDRVDAIIQRLIADPRRYRDQVGRGQLALQRFSEDAFRQSFSRLVREGTGALA